MLCAILVLVVQYALGDVSLSFAEFGPTLRIESSIIKTLDESIKAKRSSQDVQNIKRYIGNFRALTNNLTEDFQDPLQAYLVVKHLTDDFENLKNSILDNDLKEIVRKVNKVRNSGGYPTSKDLDESAKNLITIQQVYDLKINEVSSDKKLNQALGIFDFFRMAGQSLLSMDVSLAIEWFETGLKALSDTSSPLLPKQTLDAVKQQFTSIKSVVGNNFESFRQQIKSVPDFMIDALALQFPGLPVAIIKNFKATLENVGEQKMDKTYKKLCRGQHLTNDVLENNKICFVLSRGKQSAISLYKVEILSVEPLLFIVHDFLSPATCLHLQQLVLSNSNKKLETDEDDSIIHGARVNELKEVSDDILAKVSRGLNILSALNIKQNRRHLVKIIRYGIGGHEDYLERKKDKSKASPKASVELFLNDVRSGGKTIFPGLRLHVSPKQGSVLFIYHVLKENHIDMSSFQASCPVRSGSKWILRKKFY